MMSFFNTRLAIIFFFFLLVEVRAFTLVVLKILAFSTSKSYFIYFTTSLYNTPNIKCSFLKFFFFITSSKIIFLIKYCILFLTICYNQLVFIVVYCSCKKTSFSFSNKSNKPHSNQVHIKHQKE